jgi:hypothetical protein
MPEIMEPTATPSGIGFPEVLKVIEGVVVVDTHDHGLAAVAFSGFVYRLSLEFARQQPDSLCCTTSRSSYLGSKKARYASYFERCFDSSNGVAEEIKKAGAVATLGVVLAIPPGVTESEHLYKQLFPPVHSQVQNEMPSCRIDIEIATIRSPDDSDMASSDRPPHTRHDAGRTRHRRSRLRGGSFDL